MSVMLRKKVSHIKKKNTKKNKKKKIKKYKKSDIACFEDVIISSKMERTDNFSQTPAPY